MTVKADQRHLPLISENAVSCTEGAGNDVTSSYNPTFALSAQTGESFLVAVQQASRRAGMDSDAWNVRPSDDGAQSWIWAQHLQTTLPEQGWKLHVSATMLSAPEVLRRVLPVLFAEDAAFKVAASIGMLGNLNAGSAGLSQVGKFIVVYPNSDEKAVRLAQALHRVTQGLRGPVVPSDKPLLPGSLVHYRYGAFQYMNMQNQLGDMQFAMRTPEGELVPDERYATYKPPEWVTDPFIAAGISTPTQEPNPLIGGRYLALSMLAISPRGTVHAAVDLVVMRRCVLKRAYRDAAMGPDGTDAWDRLRNEAMVLARLAPDERFPRLYDMVEQDGDLFLVMEDIEGMTLASHVNALAREGRYLPVPQVIRWGLELADMLGAIHSKGLAYRDLKSSNVIVSPDGALRLIDFDVAMDLSAPRPLYSPGTYGYMTREQELGEPPRIAHDIYALGALLYFLATWAEPSMFPHYFDLLRRPVATMNPNVPPALSEIIACCLEPDPDRRYISAAEVQDALMTLATFKVRGSTHHNYIELRTLDLEPIREHYRQLARRLGDTLCERAIWGLKKRGRMWAGAFGNESGAVPRDISVGSAGAVLMLAELARELGDERHLGVLAEAAHELALSRSLRQEPLPGLYVGEAGVGAALLRAGQVLGDSNLIEAAVAKGQLVSGLPHTSPTLFNGTAGRVRYHLLLWDETGAKEHLVAATEAGEKLLHSAERVGERGLGWTIPQGYGQDSGRAYLGYSLGAAGIGDALLDLFEATGEERFLKGAQGAGHWIASAAIPTLDDDSGLDWPTVVGGKLGGAFWRQGASGVGRFLLHAARLDIMPGVAELLNGAAHTAARGTRWAGPTLGYGLCGPIEFLLDLYQWTRDESYLRDAYTLAQLLESFMIEQDRLLVWPSENPRVYTASLMAGYAGVAYTLLRLGIPERVPHPLGRKSN